MEELEKVIRRTQGRLAVIILFVHPDGAASSWERSILIDKARILPCVSSITDLSGAEARRFGARTSGHAALYDAGGRLVFSGGLTWARGHVGDNPGSEAVVSFVRSGKGSAVQPVYGCPLESLSRAPGNP